MHRPASPNDRNSLAEEKEGLTPQQRQMIGIGGVVLCLLIGAGIIYWLLVGNSPRQRTVKVDPKEQTQNFSGRPDVRAPVPRHEAGAIWQIDDNNWQGMGQTAAIRINKQSDGTLKVTSYYYRDFLNKQLVTLISGIVRAQHDEAMAKQWGLSADQQAQIKKITIGPPLVVMSETEQQEMMQLADAFLKAGDGSGRRDAELKVTTRLDELAKANLQASRTPYMAKLDEVKKIVTPEQLARMTKK